MNKSKTYYTKLANKIHVRICQQNNTSSINKIRVKNIQSGCCTNNSISIPMWAYKERGHYYFIYYVIHETVHHVLYNINKSWKHDVNFLECELELLKQYHLKPIYKRVYVKSVERYK